MTLLLTPSQQRTLDLSSHLSVTANAGAGKTSVLARRFVEIFLRTDAKLPEVVAITFTEQAAGELRKKIHDVIIAREREPECGAGERRRLSHLRNHLPSAVIGTIHSFCSRILRMYPTEADIDASFTVIEGQDRGRLIGESIGETFAAFMGRGDETGAEGDFRDLLRAVPPARLERLLQGMFSQREKIYRLFTLRAERARGGDVAGEGGTIDAILSAIVDRAVESGWIRMARETAAAASGRDAAKVSGMLGADDHTTDRAGMIAILAGAGGAMFVLSGDFRKSFLGDVPAESLPRGPADFLREFESRYGAVLRIATRADAREMDHRYGGLVRTLERLFTSAQARYDAKKDEIGALDFEDLQIRTLELLTLPAVLDRVRSDYRFFLVDEFQDTNDLQYSILKGLLGKSRGSNIFIVGDPKQSIYGFRNAEVGVFYDARNDIASARRSTGVAGGDGSVVLAESFRPLSELAAFVNTLFSALMSRAGSRFDVDYDEIVVGRTSRTHGKVGILLVPDGAGPDRMRAIREECTLVAHRLRAIAGEGGEGRHSFGECAVLLRDRANLSALERAFEEAGVPYLLAGGVGFFQTQEVYDFLNYVRFLVSPADDAALAGILRSPFFGLSDADLFGISLSPGSCLWEKTGRSARGAGAPPLVRRAVTLLSAHRSLADRLSVPRLLRRIAADTGWLGTMAGLSHGPQHRENFLKLLELARRRGIGGPFTLYDFGEYLDHRAEEEEREGQAATAATGRAVRVMTVHAAKGLEFPVVLLPFLDRIGRSDREPIIHPEYGIGFSIGPEGEGKSESAPLHAFLRALSEEKGRAEEKRVFYVACTRARDVLILSGTEGEKIPPHSPLGWVRGVMRTSGIVEVDSAFDFGSIPIRCLEAGDPGPARIVEKPVRLRVTVHRPERGPAMTRPAAGGAILRPVARDLTAPLLDTRGGETYSATRLKTYADCPAKYYLSYILGLGQAGNQPGRDEPVDRDPQEGPGLAVLEGEITHEILSGIDAAASEPAVASKISALVRARHADPAASRLERRVGENVSVFRRSPAGLEILSRPGARTEYPVSAVVGDAIVMGKIDRLFTGRDALVEFVDYKTDEITREDMEARAEEHRTQIAIYAYLVSRLYRQPVVRGTLLFLKAGGMARTFQYGATDFPVTEKRLLATIEGIRKSIFTPPPIPCRSCPAMEKNTCTVVPATS